MCTRSHRRRFVTAVVAIMLTVFALPSAAAAHTALDFSVPDDGETVAAPVDEVTVAFTTPVELVGSGFEALDPQGNLLQPAVISDDDQVFTLLFDPPLAGGGVGVRYEIRSADGHVVSDSFSFVVDAPVPTTAPGPSSTVPAATEPPASTAPATEATEPVPTAAATTVAPATPAPVDSAATTTASTTDDEGADGGSSTGILLAILAVLAVGVGGFFVVRSRTSGGP